MILSGRGRGKNLLRAEQKLPRHLAQDHKRLLACYFVEFAIVANCRYQGTASAGPMENAVTFGFSHWGQLTKSINAEAIKTMDGKIEGPRRSRAPSPGSRHARFSRDGVGARCNRSTSEHPQYELSSGLERSDIKAVTSGRGRTRAEPAATGAHRSIHNTSSPAVWSAATESTTAS
jgi:hypothetical protein